jgi:hypothetical protein
MDHVSHLDANKAHVQVQTEAIQNNRTFLYSNVLETCKSVKISRPIYFSTITVLATCTRKEKLMVIFRARINGHIAVKYTLETVKPGVNFDFCRVDSLRFKSRVELINHLDSLHAHN